jgi:hypothetical protein
MFDLATRILREYDRFYVYNIYMLALRLVFSFVRKGRVFTPSLFCPLAFVSKLDTPHIMDLFHGGGTLRAYLGTS